MHAHPHPRFAALVVALLLLPTACEEGSDQPDRTDAVEGIAVADAGQADTAIADARAGAVSDAPEDAMACTLDPPPEPDEFGGPECEACIQEHCCAEYNAAFGPEGAPWLMCWFGCLLGGSQACLDECDEEHPGGAALFQAFHACAEPQCATCND